MSELRTLALSACLTVGAIVAPLEAQHGSADSGRARLELRRLDSLYAVRRIEYLRAESLAAVGRHLQLVESGALRIRVSGPLAARTREAAGLTVHALESRGGDALRTRMARHLPSITLGEEARVLGVEWHVRVSPDTGRYRVPSRRFSSAGRVRTNALAEQLAWLVESYAMDGADAVLVGWVMGGQLPLRERPADSWAQAYVELMTVESVALRRCRAGDADACLAALGVLPDEASRFHAWYAPDDYRSLAHLIMYDRRDTATAAAMRQCRGQGDVEACTALVAKLPPQRVAPPLSAETRHLFLGEVLRSGGDGAYARLMTAEGSMRERLQATAGVPLEQVVDGWRTRVIEARPRDSSLSPGLALATLGWCGLFALAAFSRRPACG